MLNLWVVFARLKINKIMNRSELNEKAKKYISNAGFGTGTNITLHGLKCMMVDFYIDNQGQTLPIDSVVVSSSNICTDTNEECKHNCSGLCKERC
jgi:hypothetical protein